jgi:tetratricopeptide (TPR) repeat protein
VPLFGVGEDDGTPWLAMQFIDGESFDGVLRRLADAGAPRLSPGEVARHGLAVADALTRAHAEGVLHRDVKPSNLLLDRSGTVWITDFGLAKSEGAASITRTGETVGTPRYMAPEAFSGWADPRSDVWGVGATLYEMLAGRPAFDGRDRAQLLRQIQQVEPAPLRRTDPAIPRDLATIVHKCLQKEPAARYASALELADDLRRFVDGRPIDARPPSLAYRVGLMTRRHRIAVRAGIAIAAGFVVVLVAWAITLSNETVRSRAAETKATRRFNDLRQLAGSFLFEFHDAIRNLPGSTPARALIVKRGLEYLDKLVAEAGDDAGLRRELAIAYQRVGDVQGNPYQPNLGDLPAALASYRRAIGLLEPLVTSGQASVEDRAILATAWLVSGGIELATGDKKGAVEMSQKGLELRKALALEEPTPARRLELATAWQYVAFNLVGAGRDDDVMRALDEQAAILRDLFAKSPDDATVLRSLGQNLYLTGVRIRETGNSDLALQRLEEAITVQRRLIAAEPDNPVFRRDLGWTLADRGITLQCMKRFDDALACHVEALELAQSTAAADPQSRDARSAVAVAQLNVSADYAGLGNSEQELDHATDSITRCQALLVGDPTNALVERILATAYGNAADANFRFGDPVSLDAAHDLFEKSIATYVHLEAVGHGSSEIAEKLAFARRRITECEAKMNGSASPTPKR